MFLSVITPTYNRAHTLSRCYESLLGQTCTDFEWIVVDDGSEDETKELIAGFIKEARIDIKYFYRKNGGKHRAHNLGVKNAKGCLCVCLDSDDALSPDAVETVQYIWENTAGTQCIGILAKRGDFEEHKPICASWPEEVKQCTMMELQQVYQFSGDTALFFDTAIMQKNYFKEFENEKFLAEDSLYAQLDQIGPMLLLNKVVYYCKYLPDGLTARYKELLVNNPQGTAYCYYKKMCSSKGCLEKLKNAIISQSYLSLSQKPAAYSQEEGQVFLVLAKLAVPLYRKVKIGR